MKEHTNRSDPRVAVNAAQLPKGGGAINGIGESFEPHAFSGSGAFSIPIYTSKARGFEPHVSLNYSSGGGNGIFGLGFSLSIPEISRRTRLGTPKYNDSDVFTLSSEGDLVEKLFNNNGEWAPQSHEDSSNQFTIFPYVPRQEGSFHRIEKWVSKADQSIHWRVTDPNGTEHVFGQSASACVSDPNDASHVFRWLLEQSTDSKGNQIQYEYKAEDGHMDTTNTPVYELDRSATAQLYPYRIKYGNVNSALGQAVTDWHFELVFDYGERNWKNISSLVYDSQNPWKVRMDPFSSYKSGFEIRTYRLCRGILLFHRFDDLNNGAPFLVRGMQFTYDENPAMSMLTQVEESGFRDYGQGPIQQKLPVVELGYTQFDPSNLAYIDKTLYESSLTAGTISNELYKELQFRGIELSNSATLSQSTNSGSKNPRWNLVDDDSSYVLEIDKHTDRIVIYQPSLSAQFKEFSFEAHGTAPGTLGRSDFQFADLYGEGLPGILYTDQESVFYWYPQGEGTFATKTNPASFPLEHQLHGGDLSLTDLSANGKKELVLNGPQFNGFFELEKDGSWGNFQGFDQYPSNYHSGKKEVVDLTGDGLPDLVFFEQNNIAYSASMGEDGFRQEKYQLRDIEIPFTQNKANNEIIQFADMAGDGKSHLVRVRNGEVAYWPNLGYGKFGSKVLMANAPTVSGKLTPSRMFFADIDGTGTQDLVYAHANFVEIFINQCGNSFADPIRLNLPGNFSTIDQIQFADILGNGTSSLILTSRKQDQSLSHQYYSFAGGRKPYMLSMIDNHLGSLSRMHYASSVKFYLEDLKQGKPWITNLAFPVQVIEEIETVDYFSETSVVASFKYHDGFYDPVEREFRGFGFVERFDTKPFDIFNPNPPQQDLPDVAPVYTKSWYHTGASFAEVGTLTSHYKEEYFQLDTEAYEMPDSVFVPLNEGDHIDGHTYSELYRTLHGTLLREEIYGMDTDQNPDLVDFPYAVSMHNVSIQLLQPAGPNPYASFLLTDRESMHANYERNNIAADGDAPKFDPRITHDFTLHVDEFGHPLQTCQIAYGRRETSTNSQDPALASYEEQHIEKISCHQQLVFNETDSFYLLGVAYDIQTFEMANIPTKDAKGYYEFDQLQQKIAAHIDKGDIISYDQSFSGNTFQARRTSWQLHYFWDTQSQQVGGYSQIDDKALLHHSETGAFSSDQLTNVFTDQKVPQDWMNPGGLLETTGGYVLHQPGSSEPDDLANDLFFKPSTATSYANANDFFTPASYTDPKNNVTTPTYDKYFIELTELTDAKQNETIITPDYYHMTPQQIEDMNQNTSQVVFDPLGEVIYTSIFGTLNGQTKGDDDISTYSPPPANTTLDAVLQNPANFLKDASSFFFYDLGAWDRARQPVSAFQALREIHVQDLQSGQTLPIQLHVSFSDGLGRILEKKVKADDGEANIVDASGNVSQGQSTDRWISSSRTIYNNKGAAVEKYEPYYIDGAAYQGNTALSKFGVSPVIHYDPLLRPVRVDLPSGFHSSIEYSTWYQKHSDANDNDPNSPHTNTPEITILDNLGRDFMHVQLLHENSGISQLFTHHSLDIVGRELNNADPRLYTPNQNQGPFNFSYTHAMSGEVLHFISSDAGERWTLSNAMGQAMFHWDARGTMTTTHYDELNRPVNVHVLNTSGQGLQLDQVVNFYEYGAPSDADKNLNGKLKTHFDEAGAVYMEAYGIQGELLQSTRQLSTDFENEVNWTNPPTSRTDSRLDADVFTVKTVYDALVRPTEHIYPDGSTNAYTYLPQGALKSNLLSPTGVASQGISAISYNAKGQREAVNYQNGVSSAYTYEPKTFRLSTLKTTASGKNFQDLTYTYDAVGNVLTLEDNSINAVYNNNNVVAATNTYTYDDLYRLQTATGRHHNALQGNEYASHQAFIPATIANINNPNQIETYERQYQYDHSGNLKSIQQSKSSHNWTRSMQPKGQNNQLDTYARTSSGGSTNMVYDPNGNLTKLDNIQAIAWNYRNNISSATIIDRSAQNQASDMDYYVYDSAGMRIRKISQRLKAGSTVIEEKVYIGDYEVVRERNGNTWTEDRRSVHLMDGDQRVLTFHNWITGRRAGTQQFRYQYDNHLGSVSLELDENAALISYEEYYPYGGTALITGKSGIGVRDKEYRYSGKERDGTTGLYYYGARYYAPWMGRWLSADPAWRVNGLNIFAFVKGNPVTFRDWKGFSRLKGLMIGLIFGFIIGSILSYVFNGTNNHSGQGEHGSKILYGATIGMGLIGLFSRKRKNYRFGDNVKENYEHWDEGQRTNMEFEGREGRKMKVRHNRGAPFVNMQAPNGRNYPNDYSNILAQTLGASGDQGVARDLLDNTNLHLNTRAQRDGAAFTEAIVGLAENWRKFGASKIYRAILRGITNGVWRFADIPRLFGFIKSANTGRRQVGRIQDVYEGRMDMSGLSNADERSIVDHMSDGEGMDSPPLVRRAHNMKGPRLFSQKYKKK